MDFLHPAVIFLVLGLFCEGFCNSTQGGNAVKCQGPCDKLSRSCYDCPASCFDCDAGKQQGVNKCRYGEFVNINCSIISSAAKQCTLESGERNTDVGINITKKFQCRYCYLTQANVEHSCPQTFSTFCDVYRNPPEMITVDCEVHDNVFCLGHRKFKKRVRCNWTSGYSWSTTLLLSVTVGGFGIDRFYLGYWKEGLGKFFSFGGLGVWTLIDLFLVLTGYLTPSDGSLYVR